MRAPFHIKAIILMASLFLGCKGENSHRLAIVGHNLHVENDYIFLREKGVDAFLDSAIIKNGKFRFEIDQHKNLQELSLHLIHVDGIRSDSLLYASYAEALMPYFVLEDRETFIQFSEMEDPRHKHRRWNGNIPDGLENKLFAEIEAFFAVHQDIKDGSYEFFEQKIKESPHSPLLMRKLWIEKKRFSPEQVKELRLQLASEIQHNNYGQQLGEYVALMEIHCKTSNK